jgi:hypothetical protein
LQDYIYQIYIYIYIYILDFFFQIFGMRSVPVRNAIQFFERQFKYFAYL